jgi:hypothetical protein
MAPTFSGDFKQTLTGLQTQITWVRTSVGNTWGAWQQTARGAPGQILATATNDNAAAGNVGEVISNSVSGFGSFSSNVPFNMCSITLTAGDWDVSAQWQLSGSPWTVQTMYASISSTSATIDQSIGHFASNVGPFTQYYGVPLTVGPTRWTVASGATVTLYLVSQVSWNAGGGSLAGVIRARRMR